MAANRANIGWYIDNQIGGKDDRFTGRVYDKEVKLTSSEILALLASPKLLVAAPGAGQIIELLSAVFFLDAGTAYANGGDLTIQTVTGNAALTPAIAAADLINQAADHYRAVKSLVCSGGDDIELLSVNQGIELVVAGAEHITGTGTLTVKVMYRIHDFN